MAAVVARSVKYLSMNWSPSVRACWTLSTSRLLQLELLLQLRVNCASSDCCSRRRSSADPPNGLKAITAAARFATSSTPMIAAHQHARVLAR